MTSAERLHSTLLRALALLRAGDELESRRVLLEGLEEDRNPTKRTQAVGRAGTGP